MTWRRKEPGHQQTVIDLVITEYFGFSTRRDKCMGSGTESSGPWFNLKMLYYQYRKSHCGDKTVVRSSYPHNGISYTGKMSSLYWIRPLIFIDTACVVPVQINLFLQDRYPIAHYWGWAMGYLLFAQGLIISVLSSQIPCCMQYHLYWNGPDCIDGLVQDCSNSIANALELLQCYIKPSVWYIETYVTLLK